MYFPFYLFNILIKKVYINTSLILILCFLLKDFIYDIYN